MDHDDPLMLERQLCDAAGAGSGDPAVGGELQNFPTATLQGDCALLPYTSNRCVAISAPQGSIETSIGRTAEMAGYADTPEGLRAFERVRLNGITSERYATIAPMAQQVVMREHVWGHLDGSIKKDLTLVAAVLESSDRRGRQLLVDACIVSEVAKANLKSGTISSAATGPYAIFVLEEIDRALGRATYEAELATRAQVGGLFEATAVDSKAMPALVEVLERISVVNEADAYVAMSANEIGWTRRDHRYMIDDLHATRDPRGTEDDSSAEDGHGRPFLRGNS